MICFKCPDCDGDMNICEGHLWCYGECGTIIDLWDYRKELMKKDFDRRFWNNGI